MKTDSIRIYVACLAAYNNGYLHGAWIDADQKPWELFNDISTMLNASPIAGAEEWAIHDYEGFEGVSIAEYEGLESVSAKAAFICEHGRLGAEVISHTGSIEEARTALDDGYLGQYDSLADYVQDVTEESVSIPESLQYYIDWQAMARDVELSGDLFTVETAFDEVHIFSYPSAC